MERLNLNEIYNMDCLEGLKLIPDNSIDLVCTDPPYNIKKASWDSWKTIEAYVEFMGEVFKECERVLKPNGSMYWFHNDFLQIVELQNWLNKNTSFVFKQLIVWNKRYEGSQRKYYFDNVIKATQDRNYRLMAEYCLFYTFQDETGRKLVDHDPSHYTTLREYSRDVIEYIGMKKKDIIGIIGQRADHFFRHSSTQFSLPTKETYEDLTRLFNIERFTGFREYEDLKKKYEEYRKEYEENRKEYEAQRYVFNNQKTHHSVWNYEVAKNLGHITPKPVEMIENIIKHSSHENQIVLDPFMGSGTTAVACKKLNRNFIGFELDENYFNLANKRLEENT